ncbi:hypothetical protein ZOSMA_12520G00010, partial [Zostera marina]
AASELIKASLLCHFQSIWIVENKDSE